jgi:hypothetical protein
VESGQLRVLNPYRIRAITKARTALEATGTMSGHPQTVAADEIVVATGSRPDLDMLREIRLGLDPGLESAQALGALIDPNEHSCGTVRPHGAHELAHPEKDFFVIGMKSYGRAPTFLLATGYEQARSVVAFLVGDVEAAARVELALPETGVCSTPVSAAACCGTAAVTSEPTVATVCAHPVRSLGEHGRLGRLSTAGRWSLALTVAILALRNVGTLPLVVGGGLAGALRKNAPWERLAGMVPALMK